MSTFKVTLAYDGTDYVGWQRQASGVSIQGLLEDALRALDGRDVAVAGAGRTDAGVHALGQVASFSLERSIDVGTLTRALNGHLPQDVRVVSAEAAPDGFHARFDARAKTYRYRIWNGPVASPFERRYVWHIVDPLDVDAMNMAAARLVGEHDFASFQSAGGEAATTVRRVFSSELIREPPSIGNPQSIRNPQSAILNYEITGDGFLRHMVRAIAGSLIEVGRRRRAPEWMADVLAARDRSRAGDTAPAAGLFLVSVAYDAFAAEP